MMPPAPPPPLPVAKKSKIPMWVWFLTVFGVLFIGAIYVGVYFVFNKATDLVRTGFAEGNPEFELMHIANFGRVKIRHKATGKQFLIMMPDKPGPIRLRPLTTKAASTPSWFQLRGAEPYQGKGWSRQGDTGQLREALEDLVLDRDFVFDSQTGPTDFTVCNHKLLQCAVVHTDNVDDAPDNRSWYSVSFFEAP